jgi:preprotein translocase subunit SecE
MAAEEKKGGAVARKFSSVVKFFRDCTAEIKKIVWPTPKTAFKNMGIVLVAMIVIGLFVYGLDSLFGALLQLVMDV